MYFNLDLFKSGVLLAGNSSTSLALKEWLHLYSPVHWQATLVPAERTWFDVGLVPTPVVPGDIPCCYTSEPHTPCWAFSLLVLHGQDNLLKEVYNMTTLLLTFSSIHSLLWFFKTLVVMVLRSSIPLWMAPSVIDLRVKNRSVNNYSISRLGSWCRSVGRENSLHVVILGSIPTTIEN